MSLRHLLELSELAKQSAADLDDAVARYVEMVRESIAGGGTVYFAGNGGSAAHAQHIATEYVVRYKAVKRRAVSVIALSTDSSLLTASANDLGFDEIFARQVEAHGKNGDVLVLVSTSGNSKNLLKAAAAAKTRGVATVGLLAAGGGPLAQMVDLAIVVPTSDTALAQEVQLAIDHHVCSLIESAL
ncbi:MAG: SIS domain-containing protein [Gemmatimonadales bacterium]